MAYIYAFILLGWLTIVVAGVIVWRYLSKREERKHEEKLREQEQTEQLVELAEEEYDRDR